MGRVSKGRFDLMKIGIPGLYSRNDDHIPSDFEYAFIPPIGFPDQPGQMMPYHAVSHLLGDGDSQPVSIKSVRAHIQDQEAIGHRLMFPIDLLKIDILLERFTEVHKSSHKVEKTT